MTNFIRIETYAGDNIGECLKNAKKLAKMNSNGVEFIFNSNLVRVDQNSDLELALRDYHRGMSGKITETAEIVKYPDMPFEVPPELETVTVIGPDYRALTAEEIAHDKVIDKQNAERRAKQEAEWDEKSRLEKEALAALLIRAPVQMAVVNLEAWNNYKEKNQDLYGGSIIKYAEIWARLMEADINNGEKLEDCAERCSNQADVFGMSGFGYGAAVKVLTDVWTYGEQLRKWHNKDYGYEGNGVVNPAILTIDSKE